MFRKPGSAGLYFFVISSFHACRILKHARSIFSFAFFSANKMLVVSEHTSANRTRALMLPRSASSFATLRSVSDLPVARSVDLRSDNFISPATAEGSRVVACTTLSIESVARFISRAMRYGSYPIQVTAKNIGSKMTYPHSATKCLEKQPTRSRT